MASDRIVSRSVFTSRRRYQAGLAFLAYSAAITALLAYLGLACGCRVPNRHVPTTRPQGCADCHVEIACQWQSSPHAVAWTSPTFQSATDQATATACLPCHAPEPLLEQPFSRAPSLRAAYREDGIDCHACHAHCGGYAGGERTFGPHIMVQDGVRLPCAEFCGTCHTTEMQEYAEGYANSRDASETASCADCHMPRHRARLTQGHLLSLIHPRRDVPDHSFTLWDERLTAGAVEIATLRTEAAEPGLRVHVTLVNRQAGHRIPTGKFGHREVRLLAEAESSDGQVIGRAEQSLLARSSEALQPGKPADFALAIYLQQNALPHLVRLTVERVNNDRSFRHPLAVAQTALDVP